MSRFKIESVDSEGNPKVVYVVKPNRNQLAEAKKVANKAFKTLYDSGTSFFRKKLDKIMRDEGLWDDDKQKQLDDLNDRIGQSVRKLKLGGMDLESAKELALSIKRDRMASWLLLSESREFDGMSIEGQTEYASFCYLVSVCLVDEEGKQIFESASDYEENADHPYVSEATSKIGQVLHELDPNWERKLPENEFLLKYKFCNDDLSLVDEKGKLVSVNGRLIDEKGQYRTEDGGYEDVDHNPMDKDGNYLNAQPFTKNGEVIA